MGWVLFAIASVVYFVPCWVAISRKHRSQLAIGVLNIFLGWTAIGWILALVWACTSDVQAARSITKARVCPYCAEPINTAATRCKHCQADLGAAPIQCDCGRVVTRADKTCPRCGVKLI